MSTIVDFLIYSGTGNSYRVAAWMAEVAREAGHRPALHMISSQAGGIFNSGSGVLPRPDSDLLVLATPTHGFTAPQGAVRGAWRLPPGRGRAAAVVATRGSMRVGRVYVPGLEGSATLLLALILWLKGYRVVGLAGIDMPANWLTLHSGLPEDAVVHLEARARARARIEMRRWLSGRRGPIPWITLGWALLLLPASLMYALAGRFMLGKLFFASEACTGCGLCAEACPHGAIEMRTGSWGVARPYWSFRCESCMRCMAYCPAEAIEANQLLGVGVTALAGLVSNRRRWAGPRWVPKLVVNTLVGIGGLALIYPVLHRALGIGTFNKLAMRGTLTPGYRRYHEPGTPLAALMGRKGQAPPRD